MSTNPYNAPSQSSAVHAQSYGMRSVAVKRIDVLSAGTMLGAIYVLIGLIVGGIMSLAALAGAAAGGNGAAMGVITGVGALIFIPVFYGVLGFIAGAIGAVIYNLVASFVGGIRIDLEG